LPVVSDASSGAPDSPAFLPALAVVVVNWNGRSDLADCFGSLSDHDYPGLRIIMVDNGSVDDSVAWTRMHHPEVEIIETGENLRWAGGNNVALRALAGEGFDGCTLLLNNDTIVPQGSLGRLVRALVDDDTAWAATPRICFAADPARAWYDGGVVGSWSGWVHHAGIRRLTGQLDPSPRYVDYGTGCALLLGPDVTRRVGLLDEDFFFYGEDADYSLRITEAGGRILHVPNSRAQIPGPAQGERLGGGDEPAQGLVAVPQPHPAAAQALAATDLAFAVRVSAGIPGRARCLASVAGAPLHGSGGDPGGPG